MFLNRKSEKKDVTSVVVWVDGGFMYFNHIGSPQEIVPVIIETYENSGIWSISDVIVNIYRTLERVSNGECKNTKNLSKFNWKYKYVINYDDSYLYVSSIVNYDDLSFIKDYLLDHPLYKLEYKNSSEDMFEITIKCTFDKEKVERYFNGLT